MLLLLHFGIAMCYVLPPFYIASVSVRSFNQSFQCSLLHFDFDSNSNITREAARHVERCAHCAS